MSDSASAIEAMQSIPRIDLGAFPTPLQERRLPSGPSILVKDDGACSTVYGGNKVRKLEFLLADAAERGSRRLVVWGDVDSHTVAATCRFGLQQGFVVDAVVYPQGTQCYTNSGLQALASIEPKLQVHECRNLLSACLQTQRLGSRSGSYLVPLGASTPLSTLGYVHAAFEFLQQLEYQNRPVPKAIFVPFATGGTVAGLLIGMELANVAVDVVAVQTVQSVIANRRRLKKLMQRTLKLIASEPAALAERACSRLRIVNRRSDERRFRHFSADSALATTIADDLGYDLEPVFSGKAFAALLRSNSHSRDGELVFWNTNDQSTRLSGIQHGYGG